MSQSESFVPSSSAQSSALETGVRLLIMPVCTGNRHTITRGLAPRLQLLCSLLFVFTLTHTHTLRVVQ